MASHARVHDPATGCKLKLSKAKRLYEQGVIDWIVEHVTYRKLSLQEIVIRRAEIAKREEPLAVAEIPGLVYQPSPSGLSLSRRGYALIKQANEFANA